MTHFFNYFRHIRIEAEARRIFMAPGNPEDPKAEPEAQADHSKEIKDITDHHKKVVEDVSKRVGGVVDKKTEVLKQMLPKLQELTQNMDPAKKEQFMQLVKKNPDLAAALEPADKPATKPASTPKKAPIATPVEPSRPATKPAEGFDTTPDSKNLQNVLTNLDPVVDKDLIKTLTDSFNKLSPEGKYTAGKVLAGLSASEKKSFIDLAYKIQDKAPSLQVPGPINLKENPLTLLDPATKDVRNRLTQEVSGGPRGSGPLRDVITSTEGALLYKMTDIREKVDAEVTKTKERKAERSTDNLESPEKAQKRVDRMLKGMDKTSPQAVKLEQSLKDPAITVKQQEAIARVFEGMNPANKIAFIDLSQVLSTLKVLNPATRQPSTIGADVGRNPFLLFTSGRPNEVNALLQKGMKERAISNENITFLQTVAADLDVNIASVSGDKTTGDEQKKIAEMESKLSDDTPEHQRISLEMRKALQELQDPKADKTAAALKLFGLAGEFFAAIKDGTLTKKQSELGRKLDPKTKLFTKKEDAPTGADKPGAPGEKPKGPEATVDTAAKDAFKKEVEGNRGTVDSVMQPKREAAKTAQTEYDAVKGPFETAVANKTRLDGELKKTTLTPDERTKLGEEWKQAKAEVDKLEPTIKPKKEAAEKAQKELAAAEAVISEIRDNRQKSLKTMDELKTSLLAKPGTTEQTKNKINKIFELSNIKQEDSLQIMVGSPRTLLAMASVSDASEFGMKPDGTITDVNMFQQKIQGLKDKTLDVKNALNMEVKLKGQDYLRKFSTQETQLTQKDANTWEYQVYIGRNLQVSFQDGKWLAKWPNNVDWKEPATTQNEISWATKRAIGDDPRETILTKLTAINTEFSAG